MTSTEKPSGPLKVAAAQFTGVDDWEENLRTCLDFADEAAREGADLVCLPEAAMRTRADDDDRPSVGQPLDGPFVTTLAERSHDLGIDIVVGVAEPGPGDKVYNTLAVLQDGKLTLAYRKLHLYDAFTGRESDKVRAGDVVPEIFDCRGWRIGVMTCYDIRFPELARILAENGADLLVVPTSWVRGPLKEWHWEVLTAARALENGCYVVAPDKCGPTRIGMSRIVDPLGVTVAQLGEQQGLIAATLDPDRLESARSRMPLLLQRRFQVDPQPLPAPLISPAREE